MPIDLSTLSVSTMLRAAWITSSARSACVQVKCSTSDASWHGGPSIGTAEHILSRASAASRPAWTFSEICSTLLTFPSSDLMPAASWSSSSARLLASRNSVAGVACLLALVAPAPISRERSVRRGGGAVTASSWANKVVSRLALYVYTFIFLC